MNTAGDISATTRKAIGAALRDRVWWIAVAAGPLVWIALTASGVTRPPGNPALLLMFYGVVLYPILEECVFRGLLQSSLLSRPVMRQRLGPISLANAITSAIFAASHLLAQPPQQAALIFLPSLVFGYVYERYTHVAPAILIHAFYNAGFLWLFAR